MRENLLMSFKTCMMPAFPGSMSAWNPDMIRFWNIVQKGVTAQELIDAGRKVKEAGISLSEYIMPGLGGKGNVERACD